MRFLPPLLSALLLGATPAQPASAKIEVVSEAPAAIFSSKQYVVRSRFVEVSSPSIWAGGEELKRLTAAFAKKERLGSRKVYVSAGELEGKDFVAASETFSGQLAAPKSGLQIRSETLPKESHYSVPGQSIARGLIYLLGTPAPATAK